MSDLCGLSLFRMRRDAIVAARVAQMHGRRARWPRRRRRRFGLRLLFEIFVIVAEVANRVALADFEHLGYQLVEDEAIVTDYDDGAGEAPERLEQRVLGDDV